MADSAFGFVERQACPGCGGAESDLLYECRFDEGAVGNVIREHYGIDPAILGDGTYALVRCRSCSMAYQRWVGNEPLLTDLYSDWVRDHALPDEDPVYQKNVRRPRASRDGHELMVASRYLGIPLAELVTLDFGMGWALWARIAAQLGCKSHGSELAEERMAYARRHGVSTLSLEEVGDDRFHFINTEQVFEHLTDPLAVGQALAKSLRPRGILKISVPLAADAEAIAAQLRNDNASVDGERLMPVAPLEHINGFNYGAVAVFASKLGLEVVRPSLPTRYAFLTAPGAFSYGDPVSIAKELIRPLWQDRNRRNLYVWLRKPASVAGGREFRP